MVRKVKGTLVGVTALALTSSAALAQTFDPGAEVTGTVTTIETVFAGFGAVSVSALILAMVLRFARKGSK